MKQYMRKEMPYGYYNEYGYGLTAHIAKLSLINKRKKVRSKRKLAKKARKLNRSDL